MVRHGAVRIGNVERLANNVSDQKPLSHNDIDAVDIQLPPRAKNLIGGA